MYNDETRALAH